MICHLKNVGGGAHITVLYKVKHILCVCVFFYFILFFFRVLLTVHLSIFISVINPFPIPFKSLVPGQKSRVFSWDI